MEVQQTKPCTKCKETKPLQEFPIQKGRTLGVHSWCRTCHRANNVKHADARHAYYKNRRTNWKDTVAQYKTKCFRCGECDPVALDFHHRNGEEKSFQIGRSGNLNIDTLIAEIAKCVVLCANCHRKLHAGRFSL